MVFADRADAGRRLAEALRDQVGEDAVVLGLPRGGVPVGFEVASALGLPLDVIVVRKLGVPFHRELAMGAIGEGGARVLNEHVLQHTGVDAAALDTVERRERVELERRTADFRRGAAPVDLAGREVVIVDDGIATGSTARAACEVARARGARRVVLAVPVAPPDTVQSLTDVADDVVCLQTPVDFYAVGAYYRDFGQAGDEQVAALLERAHGTARAEPVEVEVPGPDGTSLGATLTVPAGACGVVAFAHGSGSSRHSPRNRYVAEQLNAAGVATLLMDLLTAEEDGDRRLVFDVQRLATRLAAGTDWLAAEPATADLPVGYFGASTGAAAALIAAADRGDSVRAVVSRGGRPDLAGPQLPRVTAPTLLIVGGHDETVLELNRAAQAQLRCTNRLEVVPGATHLFEEPGTLEKVAELASAWFAEHLRRRAVGAAGGQ